MSMQSVDGTMRFNNCSRSSSSLADQVDMSSNGKLASCCSVNASESSASTARVDEVDRVGVDVGEGEDATGCRMSCNQASICMSDGLSVSVLL